MSTHGPLHLKFLTIPLRFFFSLLYHQLAWTYDWVAATVSIGMWNQWTHLVLPYISGPLILEIGHGPGHLLVALHQSQKISIGLDLSPQMNKIAYQRLINNDIHPKLILGKAQNLPFSANCLDHIVATFPTEDIFDPNTLSESLRVLKPGGTFIVLPFAWITGNNILHKAAAWLFNITGESPSPDSSQYHPFTETGFVVTSEKLTLESSSVLILQAQKPP